VIDLPDFKARSAHEATTGGIRRSSFLRVASSAAKPASQAAKQASQDTTSAELVTLTNAWTDAMNAKDHAKLEALMAPEFAL
jgi:hypothetical protein